VRSLSIARNLRAVKERIAEAAARAGRDPKDISLVAVSKGRSIDLIKEAAENGQLAFGENRAQELRDKQGLLPADLEWHFIGHLQRNKVNMVVGKVKLIHSLDSEKLAEAVDRRARALGIVQEVLLQVNISEEETKHGADREEIEGLLEKALALDGLSIRGLMTIAPLVDDEEEARPYFSKLRELRDMLAKSYPQADLNILSMGMTQDFEIAVEEGANMLRIGTAIFA
jgi:pyridoxal phosphate enzyme (YggS family)